MAYRRRGRAARIVAVSDEPQLLTLLRRVLTADGFRVATTSTASLADASFPETDAAVIDMPAYSAKAVCDARKAFPQAALLVLLSETYAHGGVEALDHGAEFLVRPFREADLRLKLRASRRLAASPTDRMDFGPLSLDADAVLLQGEPVELSPAATALLACLIRSAGWAEFPALLATLGHPDAALDRQYVRSVVCEIRRRLVRAGVGVENERGIGYRLVPRQAPSRADR